MTPSALHARLVAEGRLAPDPAQAAVLPALDRLAADLLAPPARRPLWRRAAPTPPPRGLYLWGEVGRGKTLLMDLLLEALGPAVPVRRAHFHAFMQDVHKALEEARRAGLRDAVLPVADRIAATARLLALDEMQVQDIADAAILGRLLERLWARGTTLVTTSNRPPRDLYKDGLNRHLFLPAIARLESTCEVVEIASPRDHRQGRAAGERRWFCPLGPEARAGMDAVWASLGGADAGPRTLRVLGRDLHLPLWRDGAARAGFFDLCGRPLGPPDFLAIAGAVRVLLLDEIPQMGAESFNAARRFVLLVDALYEARVTLFASAAARPDHLYLEGEGAFDFARTASRLAEMASADWPPPLAPDGPPPLPPPAPPVA